jgi:hypothetical protein
MPRLARPGGQARGAADRSLRKVRDAAHYSRNLGPSQARPVPGVTALCPSATRLDPEVTRAFGVEQIHAVHFQPFDDRGGPRDAISILVPERDAISILVPEASRQVIRQALAKARRRRARVSIACDTFEQAEQALRLGRRLLPEHRFIALERVMSGAWGGCHDRRCTAGARRARHRAPAL